MECFDSHSINCSLHIFNGLRLCQNNYLNYLQHYFHLIIIVQFVQRFHKFCSIEQIKKVFSFAIVCTTKNVYHHVFRFCLPFDCFVGLVSMGPGFDFVQLGTKYVCLWVFSVTGWHKDREDAKKTNINQAVLCFQVVNNDEQESVNIYLVIEGHLSMDRPW